MERKRGVEKKNNRAVIDTGRIFDDLLKMGHYPPDFFPRFWKIPFICFLPLVVIAQVLSQVLLGVLSFKFGLYSFGLASVSLIVALNFWKVGMKVGIKNYSSAST